MKEKTELMGRMFKPKAPGRAGAREAEIKNQMCFCEDAQKLEMLNEELESLYRSAWQWPLREEDVEWARLHREACMRSWLRGIPEFAGKWAHKGYITSSDGTFDGKPAPWETVNAEAWCAFGERVVKATAEESEQDIFDAAIAAYASVAGPPVPRCSDHWLAAVRNIRRNFVTPKE